MAVFGGMAREIFSIVPLQFQCLIVHDKNNGSNLAMRGSANCRFKCRTKFELVIRLRTAKKLGLDVPNDAARLRRRGDRMKSAISVVGTKRTCRSILAMSVVG